MKLPGISKRCINAVFVELTFIVSLRRLTLTSLQRSVAPRRDLRAEMVASATLIMESLNIWGSLLRTNDMTKMYAQGLEWTSLRGANRTGERQMWLQERRLGI